MTFLDALAGETDHDWFATADGSGTADFDPERRDEVIRGVLREVKRELIEEYGSDPETWADPGHTTKFLSLGLSNSTAIHIQSRSTYNQAIDLGRFNSDDPVVWHANCQDVVPPSNSGQVNAAEGTRVVAQGEEPDRLTDQLAIYAENRSYKPHPHTRKQVEQEAVRTETIRATPERGFTPVVPAAPRPLPTPIDVPGADTPSSEDATTDSGATGDDAADTAERPTGHVTDDDGL